MRDPRVLVATSLYHLANDASVNVLPALFPIIRDALAFGYAEVGLITGTALVVTILFQLVFGHLSDRVGPNVLLPAGIAWLGVGMILIASSTTFGTLFLFVALARIGASAYHPVGISWISREFRGETVDRGMGVQSSFGDLGVLLGLLPSGFLAVVWGWPGVFLFWGALNLMVAAIGFSVAARVTAPRGVAADPAINPIRLLRSVALWIPPLAVGGAVFTITVTFGPLLLTDRHGFAPEWAAAAVALWIVTGGLAAFSFGRIAQRFGRFPTLRNAFLGVAVGGVIIGAAPHPSAVVLGLVAFNALLFITYPALFAFISDVADVRTQGLAYGVIFGFQLVGGSLAAYASGVFATATGNPASPFYLMAALALVTFAYLLVLREARAPAEVAVGPP